MTGSIFTGGQVGIGGIEAAQHQVIGTFGFNVTGDIHLHPSASAKLARITDDISKCGCVGISKGGF